MEWDEKISSTGAIKRLEHLAQFHQPRETDASVRCMHVRLAANARPDRLDAIARVSLDEVGSQVRVNGVPASKPCSKVTTRYTRLHHIHFTLKSIPLMIIDNSAFFPFGGASELCKPASRVRRVTFSVHAKRQSCFNAMQKKHSTD